VGAETTKFETFDRLIGARMTESLSGNIMREYIACAT
jgi:hypothetical protein